MPVALYDLWNAAVLDSQHYLDGQWDLLVGEIKPKQVRDFHGNLQPGLELSFNLPSDKKEVFALGTKAQEDTRFINGAEEALNFNDLDLLLGLFGFDRESYLLAQGFEKDREISASVLSALINFNNADDPGLALEPDEIETFDKLLADLKKNGLKTDFTYVVPIADSFGVNSYHVVFEPADLKQSPSFESLQSKDLTDEQQEVWDLFVEKSRGATIEQKEQAITTNANFLPKNLRAHAQKWLAEEKLLAEKLGSSVTDPFPADVRCKNFVLGLPAYDYKPNFLQTEYGSHRVDTFIVNFEASLTDPNGHTMASIPVAVTFFCTAGTEPDTFTKLEFDAFDAKDRDGKPLAWDDPLYEVLVGFAEDYLDAYGRQLKEQYRGTAANVFMVMPKVHDIRQSENAVQYQTERGLKETSIVIPENLSEAQRQDWFKAALMEKLPSREQFDAVYQDLLKTQNKAYFPGFRRDDERVLSLSDVVGEVAVTDGKNAFRLSKTNLEINGDYVLFCLRATQDATMEVCSLEETKTKSQKDTQVKAVSRGR